MVSIADRVAAPALAGADAIRAAPAPATVATPIFSLPAGERELRIDLFRGLALWLIFIDHMSPDVLTWFTIRNYGFSDAAEIFIFISGYTAAFVYGRAMLESGFVVASARIMKRVWQIYLAHVLLFAIFIAEVSFVAVDLDKPFYARKKWTSRSSSGNPTPPSSQALLLQISPAEHGRAAALYGADVFSPAILLVIKWRADVMMALSVALYWLAWKYDFYLTAYPNGFWAFNPFAWQMLFVFGAWCSLGGA